jgi:hypothetical protein
MSIPVKTECLDGAIGLSRTECDCFENIPTSESESGLYLDEVEGLNLKMVDAAADCETGSLWELMQTSREQAIEAFKTDLSASILKKWKSARPAYIGQTGRDRFNADYTIGAVAGQRYIFGNIKNGVWVIKRIAAIFNTSGTFDLKIYNNVQDTALHTISLTSVANKVNWITLPETLYLPMYDAQTDYLEYFLVYDNPGFKPKDNGFKCCSTQLYFNCQVPQLKSIGDARYQFHQWCNVTGINGSSVDSLKQQSVGFINHAMGLIVDGEMKCDTQAIACNDTDYTHSAIAKVKAFAIWYRAGAYLANAILSSQNVNRFTMLDREALYGKRNSYLKEYANRIEWLTDPDVDEVKGALLASGCVECMKRMFIGSML